MANGQRHVTYFRSNHKTTYFIDHYIDERIGDSQLELGIVTDINKEEYTIHLNMREPEDTSSLIDEMN